MPRRPSKQQLVVLSLPPFVVVILLLILVIGAPLWLLSWWTSATTSIPAVGTFSSLSKRLGHGGSRHRIAIIIPFVGEGPESIPPYLELFCVAAVGSSSLVDFLLIHNGVLDGYHGEACPPNVRFISLSSMERFSQLLVRVLDKEEEESMALDSKDKLARILTKHIMKYPYVLVEFKPALGHIFAEYLQGYSHWGYSDLDILFGDLSRWITREELEDFDIVTYGFGDQDRLYLRGQFTFHKNEDKINQLWRACEYLSHMDQRFARVMSGEHRLHFESAEGCYSVAILERDDIRVKYAVKAFTDIQGNDTAYSHGLYVGTGKYRDKTVIYKAGSQKDGKDLERISDTWFEEKYTVYSDTRKLLQRELGEREPIALIEKPEVKCMYWAQKRYQSKLCLDNVHSTDTLFWVDGQLYKQKHETAKFPENVVTAPFFHFQEWKRYFRASQLASFHRSSKARTFVLTKEGAIPVYPLGYRHDKHFVPSHLGLELFKWNGVKDRQQLPSHSYCLRSGPRKYPPNPPASQCRFVTSWRDLKSVEIVSGAPGWKQIDANTEVTMALTLQITAEQSADPSIVKGLLDLITLYLNRWQGQPCVLVIHVAGATPELISVLRVRLGTGSDLSYGLEACLVGAIFSPEPHFVSRKALLNMAIDAAPTRWVVSGFELERGIVVSQDTAFFAHRASRIYEDLPGNVFVIPQFGFVENEPDLTISNLMEAKQAGDLKALPKFEVGMCGGADSADAGEVQGDIFEPIIDLWWQQAEAFLSHDREAPDERVTFQRALTLDDMQLNLIGLLTEAKHYNLFSMDVSPILLTDNMGPRDGMLLSELAREVEEFGGKQCYNGLRLAQLATLGYNVNILGGAFAASSAGTRTVAYAGISVNVTAGASRCDGCFLFDVEHEDILEDIANDERRRPAKAALLWDRAIHGKPLLEHT